MLQSHPKNGSLETNWKEQVKNYFTELRLSPEKRRSLEQMLLRASFEEEKQNLNFLRSKSLFLISFCKKFLMNNKKQLFSHLIVALAASASSVAFYYFSEKNKVDFVSELVSSLQDAVTLPPDFDLVGDSNALPQLSIDSLANHSFQPTIPPQLAQTYSAYEGRFFLYKGQQGVSITMEPHASSLPAFSSKISPPKPAVLYIVKLSQKNENLFPKKKVLKKIHSSSAKINKVYAWRDGAYGYAMVQPQIMGEQRGASNLNEKFLVVED
jgi:hypothetical protein